MSGGEYLSIITAGQNCGICLCPVIQLTCLYSRSCGSYRLIENQRQRNNGVIATTISAYQCMGIRTAGGQHLSVPCERITFNGYRVAISDRTRIEREGKVITIHHITTLGGNHITQVNRSRRIRYGIRHILPCSAYQHFPFSINHCHCQIIRVIFKLLFERSECNSGVNRSIICYRRQKQYLRLCVKQRECTRVIRNDRIYLTHTTQRICSQCRECYGIRINCRSRRTNSIVLRTILVSL